MQSTVDEWEEQLHGGWDTLAPVISRWISDRVKYEKEVVEQVNESICRWISSNTEEVCEEVIARIHHQLEEINSSSDKLLTIQKYSWSSRSDLNGILIDILEDLGYSAVTEFCIKLDNPAMVRYIQRIILKVNNIRREAENRVSSRVTEVQRLLVKLDYACPDLDKQHFEHKDATLKDLMPRVRTVLALVRMIQWKDMSETISSLQGSLALHTELSNVKGEWVEDLSGDWDKAHTHIIEWVDIRPTAQSDSPAAAEMVNSMVVLRILQRVKWLNTRLTHWCTSQLAPIAPEDEIDAIAEYDFEGKIAASDMLTEMRNHILLITALGSEKTFEYRVVQDEIEKVEMIMHKRKAQLVYQLQEVTRFIKAEIKDVVVQLNDFTHLEVDSFLKAESKITSLLSQLRTANERFVTMHWYDSSSTMQEFETFKSQHMDLLFKCKWISSFHVKWEQASISLEAWRETRSACEEAFDASLLGDIDSAAETRCNARIEVLHVRLDAWATGNLDCLSELGSSTECVKVYIENGRSAGLRLMDLLTEVCVISKSFGFKLGSVETTASFLLIQVEDAIEDYKSRFVACLCSRIRSCLDSLEDTSGNYISGETSDNLGILKEEYSALCQMDEDVFWLETSSKEYMEDLVALRGKLERETETGAWAVKWRNRLETGGFDAFQDWISQRVFEMSRMGEASAIIDALAKELLRNHSNDLSNLLQVWEKDMAIIRQNTRNAPKNASIAVRRYADLERSRGVQLKAELIACLTMLAAVRYAFNGDTNPGLDDG